MKHPLRLKLFVAFLIMIAGSGLFVLLLREYLLLNAISFFFIKGFFGILTPLFTELQLFGDFSNFVLILTLIAISLYAYYSYRQTKEIIRQADAIWEISASYELKQIPEEPNEILFIINNTSRYPLECWCKLNATVLGRPSFLGGFYDGKSPFPVQPFQTGVGHFNIGQIISNAGLSLSDVIKDWNKNQKKETLSLNIDFWFYPVSKKELKREAPRYKFYFDFSRTKIVLDV
jgi:Ca2+/Na+ antiporter